jgi:serine/threonine-protein kinase SRK2
MADIWSCGIILFAMLFGRYPFNARERDYVKKIVEAKFVLPSDVPVSEECKNLLNGMLRADPKQRLPMDSIKAHPWFIQELPGGALEMNNFYLQAPQFLDMVSTCGCLACYRMAD